ncbi:MAG: cytochrome c oxidase subunit 3 [Gammaproteobacteria bacterium]|nr:cytochrome c oxidase subunit 3 [Gammaproteobacteria bacterium]MDP2139702.1 cytochrome c oxidase subunit 3 [Gammaproteobacteria bacterium]MDP2348906.1 cytochrome c oxidase subunit 3 [Gammaproteobacteria bacterium]
MSFYKQVTSKPWEYQEPGTGTGPEVVFGSESEKIALALFLIVVSVIFSLLTVTYYLRMDIGDWVPLADPSMLWLNTGLLVVSSVLFQYSRTKAQVEENLSAIRLAFFVGGICAMLFVGGQLLVWQQLDGNGLGVASNPSSAFFYLLTGMHAVHLIGGLWVWSKTSFRLFSTTEVSQSRLSIELCTTYWHFLLVLWVLLFAVLANT